MMHTDNSTTAITATLPRPWQEDVSFSDILHDWMSRAPWLAISAAGHLIAFLILAMIPWELFQQPEEASIIAKIQQVPEQVFEDPPVEPESLPEEEPTEEPVLMEAEVSDHDETADTLDSDTSANESEFVSDFPFEDLGSNEVIGIGGGAGPKGGDRGTGRKRLRRENGKDVAKALEDGLEWLKRHQSADGSWNCDEFMHDSVGCTGECTGAGESSHDVGMTGLALLAFMGDGNTTRDGAYREEVAKGIRWLQDQQDPDTGLLGERIGHSFLYDHGIGALALAEAYYFSKNPLLRTTAQKAISFVTTARNPYGAWRYDVPPRGDNDTSVRGWRVFALKSAEEGGLQIDPAAYADSLRWFDEVTDPATGRTGYASIGEPSSRIAGVNDHYPADKGEAMTAVALLCRFFLGQDPKDVPIMEQQADLLARRLPEWDPDGFGCDMYYWYYGSYAMYQMGGSHWKAWRSAMEKALLPAQRQDGDFAGSWDPVGPWGFSGGRVYSTALMVLSLEVYYRYARVLGAR